MSATRAIAASAAVMAVIGMIDGWFEHKAGPSARAVFKTLLGALSIIINIKGFSAGGKFENAAHLRAYLAAIVAAAAYALQSSRRARIA